MSSAAVSSRKESCRYDLLTWRAVSTVPWTTKTSAPASCTSGPLRSAWFGIDDTAQGAPPCLICSMRWPMSPSCTGAA